MADQSGRFPSSHNGKASYMMMCWICGKAVDLETCNIDEHGRGVHENCYVAKMALENGAHTSKETGLKRTAYRTSKL